MTEIEPIDRVYGLVRELLDEGIDPRDIKEWVRDTILQWAQEKQSTPK